MRQARIVPLVLCLALTGCAAHELRCDQEKIRATLLDLYTNQILDNLVRAHQGMPIIQIDYSNAMAQVTMKSSGSISDTLPVTHAGLLNIAAKTLLATRIAMNSIGGAGTLDHTNQVSVTATPVTAPDAVYDAYAEFLAIPGSMQVTSEAPAPGLAHVCKRCGHCWYWVPIEFQREFLWLSLRTTVQRTPPIPPDPFYSVNIVEVISSEATTTDGTTKLTIKLDKYVPADTGTIDLNQSSGASSGTPSGTGSTKDPSKGGTMGTNNSTPAKMDVAVQRARFGHPLSEADGTPARLVLVQAQPAKGGAAATTTPALPQGVFEVDLGIAAIVPAPRITKTFVMSFVAGNAPKGLGSPAAIYANLPVSAKLYLRRHRPYQPGPQDPFNRIEFQLQQIQFNQLRLNGGL